MTNQKPLRVGIVGCGNIAPPYVQTMRAYPQLELAGIASRTYERCAAFADAHGLRAYPSVAELLADDSIDLIIDLSYQDAHAAVVRQCLDAGKHVYSEKPLALNHAEASALADLAAQKGLRLGSAPCTFMSESAQTAWKVIREGRLGTIRVVYAELNHGRVDRWHPAPILFFESGPLFDVGPYALSILTALLGPAARVQAHGRILLAERQTQDGQRFTVKAPDFSLVLIEFRSGALVRLTANYYVDWMKKQGGIEFHGDDGSLFLANTMLYNAPVEFAEYGKPYGPVEFVHEPFRGIEWARGIVDLADAIATDRPHRATGRQAAHVIEIMESAYRSMESGSPVDLTSDFDPPSPMDWAL